MKRTHGLISLAVLHHVTVGLALLAMLAGLLNSNPNIKLTGVLQLCSFGFFSVIVRRAWASIASSARPTVTWWRTARETRPWVRFMRRIQVLTV